jgi:amino acid adenylation domain-containing protein
MGNTIMRSSEKMAAPECGFRSLPETLALSAGETSEYPREKTLAQLFEEAVALYPDRIALISGDSRITYRELNRRANRLAHSLNRLGVKQESLVALCLDRSPLMILGILAILKAGAAYVPVDPEYPAQRIEFMLEDTQAPVVLTQRSLADAFLSGRRASLMLADDEIQDLPIAAEENPPRHTRPDSLAYVMYTSGSTGRPKGVLVENRSVVRLVFNTNYCNFGPDEVFLQFAPISFDASTFEIWGALLHGATLVIMPSKAPSLAQIGQAIRNYKVTTLWLTAGLFHLVVDECLEDLRPLRQLLAGGDVLSARQVRRVLARFPHITLINGYGPTEGTTFTCCHVMRRGEIIPDSVPIGRPISNSFVYVLDESGKPVANCEEGELYVGGDGVARGYLNSPELTAERFLTDPFHESAPARLYRTGDRVRWRVDATLEFLGRMDTQVKISGHRIELGEIEATLLRHPAIRQVCVLAKADDGGNKRLLAFYVTSDCAPLHARELKDFLALKLPAFMIPTLFTSMAALPLTPNGKIDRAALSVTAMAEARESHQSHPERTSNLEQLVADVWKKLLRQEHVGLDDNFFDLGGDSLLIVAAHAQLQKLLNREIEVTDLFEYTTIRTFSQHLAETVASAPLFLAVRKQAQKQREAFAKRRIVKGGTT